MATLTTLFGQHVQADEQSWQLVLEEADLDGLPDYVREAAAQAASERGLEEPYIITLLRSSVEPFLTFSTNRELREKAYKAWTNRGANGGDTDNHALIREIVALRAEQARLLGYATYADYKLDDTMAKTPGGRRSTCCDQVWEPARMQALAERRPDPERGIAAAGCNPAQHRGLGLAPTMRSGCGRPASTSTMRRLKPYFQLERMVRRRVRHARTKLFGVTLHARSRPAALSPGRAASTRCATPTTASRSACSSHDYFARPSKRSGAWMSALSLSRHSAPKRLQPVDRQQHATSPSHATGEPALLTFDDARRRCSTSSATRCTACSARSRYPSQSRHLRAPRLRGTARRSVYEHWLAAPRRSGTYARPLRDRRADPGRRCSTRMLAARTFGQGFDTVGLYQLRAGRHGDPLARPTRTALIPKRSSATRCERLGMPAERRHDATALPHFKHLFSGAAMPPGYYSYMWSEVLDADGFDAFKEAGDVFDPELSKRLKDIYEAGDTRDPMELYVSFRGREPKTEALLRHRGLLAAE